MFVWEETELGDNIEEVELRRDIDSAPLGDDDEEAVTSKSKLSIYSGSL